MSFESDISLKEIQTYLAGHTSMQPPEVNLLDGNMPPVWPEDSTPPTDAQLFAIPGFSSSDYCNGTVERIGYYNQLIAANWLMNDAAGRRGILRTHKDMAARNRPQKLPTEWTERVTNMKLPDSVKVAPVVYTGEDHPFTTAPQLDGYMLSLTAWAIRIQKRKFDICRTVSTTYEGQTIKFIGTETYILEAVEFRSKEVSWSESDPEDPDLNKTEIQEHFYLKAAEASSVPLLYDISSKQAGLLFGPAILNAVVEAAGDVARDPNVLAIRQSVESKVMSARYKDTGMEFGGW